MATEKVHSRDELLAALTQAGRELSARTVMFHSAIATHVGLNTTDHKALDILTRQGPVTAGQLAQLTGLTTGAITGVVDRLEAAGFVERGKDPGDRRRVIVQPLDEEIDDRIGPFFDDLTEAAADMLAQYSDEELELVLGYFHRLAPVLRSETIRLRAEAAARK